MIYALFPTRWYVVCESLKPVQEYCEHHIWLQLDINYILHVAIRKLSGSGQTESKGSLKVQVHLHTPEHSSDLVHVDHFKHPAKGNAEDIWHMFEILPMKRGISAGRFGGE